MNRPSQPTRSALSAAYERLQFESKTVRPEDLVLWSHWARLDARLAELVVKFLANHYESLNPFDLWSVNSKSSLPQALAVLVEFADQSVNARPFKVWKRAVLSDLEPADFQSFFIPESTPDPRRAMEEIGQNLRPFAKWGFFATEWIARAKKSDGISNPTMMSSNARRTVLSKLIRNRHSFTVDDFITACSGRVHRRTAERDLHSCNELVPTGFTRSRVYRAR